MRVSLLADISTQDGNAIMGSNLFSALNEGGLDVSFQDGGNVGIVFRQIDSLHIYERLQNKEVRIGCFAWEVFYVPKDWADLINNNLDFFVAFTEHQKVGLIESGVKAEKVVQIPASVNVENFKIIEKEEKDCFTFLCFGVYGPRKGYELACQAFAELYGNNKDFKLICFSWGFWKDRFMELEQKFKTFSNIVFDWQDVPIKGVKDYYAKADCLIHPTRGEGWGFTPYEALLCGLKVITTSNGELFKGARFPYKEYLDDYIFPISYTIQPVKWKHSIWNIDGIWAEPDFESLKEQMCLVVTGNKPNAVQYIKTNFSLLSAGNKWRDFIDKIGR